MEKRAIKTMHKLTDTVIQIGIWFSVGAMIFLTIIIMQYMQRGLQPTEDEIRTKKYMQCYGLCEMESGENDIECIEQCLPIWRGQTV